MGVPQKASTSSGQKASGPPSVASRSNGSRWRPLSLPTYLNHHPTLRILGPPAAMVEEDNPGPAGEPPFCSAPKALTALPHSCWGIRGTGRGGAVLWLAAEQSVNRNEG